MKSWVRLYKEHILPHIICWEGSKDQVGGSWVLSFSSCPPGPLCLLLARANTGCSSPQVPLRNWVQPSGLRMRPHPLEGQLFPGHHLLPPAARVKSLWCPESLTFPPDRYFLSYALHLLQEALAETVVSNWKCLRMFFFFNLCIFWGTGV